MIIFLLFMCIKFNHIEASLAENNVTSDPRLVNLTGSTKFSFSEFTAEHCTNGTLLCMGSVSTYNGHLSLTPDPGNSSAEPTPTKNKVGRVLFHEPVLAWPSLISTKFTIRIVKFPNVSDSGDGMAFIMAQDNRPSPPKSYGSYLGIMDKSTEDGVVKQIAVEMDTYANEFDIDNNHIGIDTVSIINPVAAKSLNSTGIELSSGRDIVIQVDYNGYTNEMDISVAYSGFPLMKFLNHPINMPQVVPNMVYVGFTASTGPFTESHQVVKWEFQSTPLPDVGHHLNKVDQTKIILLTVIPAICLVIFFGFCVPGMLRAFMLRKERIKKKENIESQARSAANMPNQYSYKQLVRATKNFCRSNLLGTGGFGSVYKGVISSNPPVTVAVKKISASSKQGEKEYLAEIWTIGRLRHKNIVRLKGWCHDGQHLLLVYEYMPNGSLDRYIGNLCLNWETRFKIIKGLASALLYLHEECGDPVVHRDIKPNNVMLDTDYNACLGDFGLARSVRNDSSATTTLAGTPGYLAPEAGYTGKLTPESDVYSFGIVAIEVITGKRSRGMFEDNSLVDFVWNLYVDDKLLQGVDTMLQGEYDEEQVQRTFVVALACLHPDPALRPKIRKVEQILMNPQEPLMDLPGSRPRFCTFIPNIKNLLESETTSTTGSSQPPASMSTSLLLQHHKPLQPPEAILIVNDQCPHTE